MTATINLLSTELDAEQEQQGLDELFAYLVEHGKYKNLEAVTQDAKRRVKFLEDADYFVSRPEFVAASTARKSIEALIQGHQLRNLLVENEGRLPTLEMDESDGTKLSDSESAAGASPDGVGETAAATGRRYSITDIFSAIELDLRTGLEQEQILRKLEGNGVARKNAEEALSTVLQQRRQKLRSRLYAVGFILLLSLLFFLFSDQVSLFN